MLHLLALLLPLLFGSLPVLPSGPLLAVLPVDFDRDGFAGYADCSPRDAEGCVRWCIDLDADGLGVWADGNACLPADVQPLDARLTLTCE